MNCDKTDQLLNAYVDGELDLMNEVDLEKHLGTCRACASRTAGLRELRASFVDPSLRFGAPAALRAKIGAMQPTLKVSDPKVRAAWIRWIPAFATAAALMLVIAFLAFRTGPSNEDVLASELVSSHVRSMMVSHLTDVGSTDQHTVKPWFDGKLDYSPPVTDLAAQGFPLTGGRLDYAAGRPVAALVYQRRLHPINLFVFPTSEADSRPRMSSRQGFNVVHWTRQGMTFWAVSDLNLDELHQFGEMLGAE